MPVIIITIRFRVTAYPGKSPGRGKEEEKMVLVSRALGLGVGGSLVGCNLGCRRESTYSKPRSVPHKLLLALIPTHILSEFSLLIRSMSRWITSSFKATRGRLWDPQEMSTSSASHTDKRWLMMSPVTFTFTRENAVLSWLSEMIVICNRWSLKAPQNLWTLSLPQADLNNETMPDGQFCSSWLYQPLVTIGKNSPELREQRKKLTLYHHVKSSLRDLTKEASPWPWQDVMDILLTVWQAGGVIQDRAGWIGELGCYPSQKRGNAYYACLGWSNGLFQGPAQTSKPWDMGAGRSDSLWGSLRGQSLFCPESSWYIWKCSDISHLME